MREMESAKGSSFALTLALSGETIIDFAQELRDAKAALVKWRKLRGDKCGGVVFSVVAPVANHPEIQSILERVYRESEEPGPFLRTQRTELALQNDREKSVQQVVLGAKGQAGKPGAKAAAPAKPPAPAKPAAPAPAPKPPADDDEDSGGSYGVTDAPETAAMPDVLKTRDKMDKGKTVKRTLKKKQVQFGQEWQAVRLPFLLFMIGLCCWGLVWAFQGLVLAMAMFGDNTYGALAESVLYEPRARAAGEYETFNRVPFAIAVLVGDSQKGTARALYIVCEVLTICRHIVWIVAYVLCLGLPNVFASKGQVIALLALGGVNLLVSLILKLLPLVGAMGFAQLPLVVPELPLASANVDRIFPLHAFWSWSPFWAYLFSVLFTLAVYAELALIVVYFWTVGIALTEEVMPEQGAAIMQLAVGQVFMLLAFHLLSLAGTTDVLIGVLWIMNILWRGFFLGLLIWFSVILLQGRKRVENMLEKKEDDEEEEDDEEDEEDEDDD